MKFHSKLDAQKFLTEIGKLSEAMDIGDEYIPTNEELKSFISNRSPLIRKIKNHRQSNVQKSNWRTNRFKIMRGIKSFHKSVEGKRFHRKLGRLLATRITRDKTNTSESVYDMHEAIIAVNSLKQHLVVELGYFHALYEQVELEELILDNALPLLSDIEKKILTGSDLTEDEITFITDMLDQNILLDELSEVTGEAFENLKKWCDSIVVDLESEGINKEHPDHSVELLKRLVLSSNENKNGV